MTIVVKAGTEKAEIEAAKQKLREKAKKRLLGDFFGKMKGVFGDGLTYQRKVRDEWS